MVKVKRFTKRQEKIILEFLGIPESEGSYLFKDPIKFSYLANQFIEKYNLESGSQKPEEALFKSWNDIFGSFSERCYPVRITDKGFLIISVPNSTLRSEMNFRKSEYFAKIRRLKPVN